MPQTRKLVRDAMRLALADESAGFNVTLEAIAPDYGIDVFVIDFGIDSHSFSESYADEQSRDDSRLMSDVKVFLYTSLSEQGADRERAKRSTFEGIIEAQLDFEVSFRDGIEVTEDMTEAYADAIEDALLSVLMDPNSANAAALFSGPVYFTGGFACPREPARATSVGYRQFLPFTFVYEVHV